MKRKERNTQRIATALELPLDVLCDVPKIEITGCSYINVENFRGILDYDENCIKINTSVGILKLEGDGLFIESITDEGVFIKGTLIRVEFIR